jgi:hypothetical protein
MMTSSGTRSPPLSSTPRRPDRPTWGTPARLQALEHLSGYRWMPWQRHVLEVALEVDPATGRLAYPTVGLSVGRQEGKSSLIDAVIAARCLLRRQQRSVYLCQDRKLAAERLIDYAAGRAARYVLKLARSNGSERLTWRNQSRWSVAAATAASARGRSLDLVVIDEAAVLGWDVVDAIGPTQAARPDPQLWVTSNAGTITSEMFWSYTELGRDTAAADPGAGMAWFEWGAAETDDRDDPATWQVAMPALDVTISRGFVAAKLTELARDPERFDREYLNRWPPGMGQQNGGVDTAAWVRAAAPAAVPAGRAMIAFDVAPDHYSAAVAVCGDGADGRPVVEILEHRPGTDWLPATITALRSRYRGARVYADDLIAAATVAELGRAGVAVEVIGAGDLARACSVFDQLLAAGQLQHRSQHTLDAAIVGAVRRQFGDGWAWSRVKSTVDITPLVAATVAAWAWRTRTIHGPPIVAGTLPA